MKNYIVYKLRTFRAESTSTQQKDIIFNRNLVIKSETFVIAYLYDHLFI